MSRLYVGLTASIVVNGLMSVLDEDRGPLYSPVFNWNYQARGPASIIPGYWTSQDGGLWPVSSLATGDSAMLGQDNFDSSGDWQPWELGYSGAIRLLYLTGTVIDANGNIVGGATVHCYRTSDDLFTGSTTTNDQGWYQVSSPYASVAHYLVAYLPGATDTAGTTVNTLVPV